MPEENYSFKPTPDIRTFGALLGHIADHRTTYCSTALGARKQGDAVSKTSKADLVAARAASFALCDSAWDRITDANATQRKKCRSREVFCSNPVAKGVRRSRKVSGSRPPLPKLKSIPRLKSCVAHDRALRAN